MNNEKWLWVILKSIGFVMVLGTSMNAWAETRFSWKEEVLLHNNEKMIVERVDIYDSTMRHEIGQGAPLAEHQTTFATPGSRQKIVWKSENRSFSDPDNLNILVIDFLNGTAYIAASIGGSVSYAKWGRPNPPYVFFKYLNAKWERISQSEFPEKFKINLIATGHKINVPEIADATNKFGFVSASLVEKINKRPGRSRATYSIVREEINYGRPRPEYKGPKAPHPIGLPTAENSVSQDNSTER